MQDDGNDQIFDIHCVSEETDIFRNGGLEDITRLIVDESKLNGSDVNVIVKGSPQYSTQSLPFVNQNL